MTYRRLANDLGAYGKSDKPCRTTWGGGYGKSDKPCRKTWGKSKKPCETTPTELAMTACKTHDTDARYLLAGCKYLRATNSRLIRVTQSALTILVIQCKPCISRRQ